MITGDHDLRANLQASIRCTTLVPTVFADSGESMDSFNVAGFRAGMGNPGRIRRDRMLS
jgi:hypothetical protein